MSGGIYQSEVVIAIFRPSVENGPARSQDVGIALKGALALPPTCVAVLSMQAFLAATNRAPIAEPCGAAALDLPPALLCLFFFGDLSWGRQPPNRERGV